MEYTLKGLQNTDFKQLLNLFNIFYKLFLLSIDISPKHCMRKIMLATGDHYFPNVVAQDQAPFAGKIRAAMSIANQVRVSTGVLYN